MVLRSFEDRLERMVEGIFARAFRSGLQPVEVGRRLVKEVDGNRTLDTQGRQIVPNAFMVRLAPEDHERFAQIHESLIAELSTTVRQYADENELRFLGGVSVGFESDERLRVGIFRVHGAFDEAAAST